MSFEYKDKLINLLDTPGHKDFAEDTYRTLTAVDSVVSVSYTHLDVYKRQTIYNQVFGSFSDFGVKVVLYHTIGRF